MEDKVLGVLLTALLVTTFTLHQAPTITKTIALTYFMDPLTFKCIRVIIKSKQMKCILCKINEVYNFLHHNCVVLITSMS